MSFFDRMVRNQVPMYGYNRILKYNLNHDERGRFTTSDNAFVMEWAPAQAPRAKRGDKTGDSSDSLSREERVGQQVGWEMAKHFKMANDVATRIVGTSESTEPKHRAAMLALAPVYDDGPPPAPNRPPLRFTKTALQFAKKELPSLVKKLMNEAAAEGIPFEQAAREKIGDAVRYTLECDEGVYTESVIPSLKALEAKGYKVLKFKNTWGENQSYQGINTNLLSPEGQQIELQFHTYDSWDVKEHANHAMYKKWDQPTTPRAEKEVLHKKMVENQNKVPKPRGVEGLTWDGQKNFKHKEYRSLLANAPA